MKKSFLTVSIVLAQMLAISAFAQTKGEADPAQSRAIPTVKATPAEKAKAKAVRKAEGAAAVKNAGPADASNKSAGIAKVATKDEKAAAKASRVAITKEAVKKGQTTSGEK